MAEGSDRRRIMRIQLGTPLVAKVGLSPVVLLDISSEGARIQHSFPLANGKEVELSFTYGIIVVHVPSLLVRCKFEKNRDRASYFSGLRFVDKKDGSLMALRDIITEAVSEDFLARHKHLAETGS